MSDEYGLHEIWRCKCLATQAMVDIIGDRAYPQHISDMPSPEFPCVSLYTLADPPSFGAEEVINGVYQMDGWGLSRQISKNIQAELKTMFHRENWSSDKVRIMQSFISNRGDIMFEDKTNIFHSYSIWNIRWIAI